VTSPGAGYLQILALDNPGAKLDDTFTGNAANAGFINSLTDIAVRFNYRMYLVWRFPAPEGETIIYTLGTMDWTVFFRANGAQPPGGAGFFVTMAAELPHTTRAFDVNDHNNPFVNGPTFNRSYQAR
jgi:hypothetical protein